MTDLITLTVAEEDLARELDHEEQMQALGRARYETRRAREVA
jgi:hypothetical protein